ncbi:MAG: alpha/beta hydrolase family protein [Rhizobiaceae bacterium]
MNRHDLAALLALPPRLPQPPRASSDGIETRPDHVVERLSLDLGHADPVRAFLTRPLEARGRLPAILYCHAHGGRYDIGAAELLDGRPALLDPPGPAFARAGFVSLCLDMPTFGNRQTPNESALSKALLWRGKTLMGEMLGDLLAGFDHLRSRPDVDPGKIAAFGLSMGATHAYFLGALEPRFARVAHLCCYADWGTLVATGAHDLHGHYMTIPGLLAKTSVGAIAGLIAPRPQLICVGYADPLTPREAVARAFEETQVAYAGAGATQALTLLAEPDAGHVETPRMRNAVLQFLGAM